MRRLIVISGCSGGGKSTLLAELGARGHSVVPEVGRRLLRDELARGGTALPWSDPVAFLRRMFTASIDDLTAIADLPGLVFFDRSLVDALSGLQHLTGEPALEALGRTHRYDATLFLAPPWPEIYVTDAERRHGFDRAEAEYHRLVRDYPALGYACVALPRLPVSDRADWLLAALGL